MTAPNAVSNLSHLLYQKQLFVGQAAGPKSTIEEQRFSDLDLEGISVQARS